MDFSLADEEIRLLKELKGAGELGRIFPQAQSVLARLIRAGYVKRHVIKSSADRYVITALGALALNNAME
jgi:6-phosphofructokinase